MGTARLGSGHGAVDVDVLGYGGERGRVAILLPEDGDPVSVSADRLTPLDDEAAEIIAAALTTGRLTVGV